MKCGVYTESALTFHIPKKGRARNHQAEFYLPAVGPHLRTLTMACFLGGPRSQVDLWSADEGMVG